MTLLVAACTPSISPAPTPTAEPSPTEAPTVVTVTPEPPTPTVAVVESQTPEPQAQQPTSIECTVTARSLRLRAGPATSFDIVQGLPSGQPLIASARNPEGTWAAVRLPDGVNGWVSIEFINCAQGVDTLPEATPVP